MTLISSTLSASLASGKCCSIQGGLARIPCLVGDSEPSLRRIDVTLEPSTWGLWVLSHVDLRATARVRVCREFLIEMLLEQRDLIEGRNSRYSGITPWNQLNSNP